jgi:hypothetical protein
MSPRIKPQSSVFLFLVPEGWRAENRNVDEVLIVAPWGYITIDWVARKARLGISTFGKPINGKVYQGRNWKKQLVHDAIACLQGLKPPPAPVERKDRKDRSC